MFAGAKEIVAELAKAVAALNKELVTNTVQFTELRGYQFNAGHIGYPSPQPSPTRGEGAWDFALRSGSPSPALGEGVGGWGSFNAIFEVLSRFKFLPSYAVIQKRLWVNSSDY